MVDSESSITSFLFRLGHFCISIVRISMRLITNLVGVLASSVDTSDSNDRSDIATSGGVLNYRTGNLDDGTDPVGWYEKD